MIRYQKFCTVWGDILMACTSRGICFLSFAEGEEEYREALARCRKAVVDGPLLCEPCRMLMEALHLLESGRTEEIPLDISGTPFQMKVWNALRTMPKGLVTYREIGVKIGTKGWQAVGNALNANPVAVIIPCHRVIASDGTLGGYRWGAERKYKLLVWEGLMG